MWCKSCFPMQICIVYATNNNKFSATSTYNYLKYYSALQPESYTHENSSNLKISGKRLNKN